MPSRCRAADLSAGLCTTFFNLLQLTTGGYRMNLISHRPSKSVMGGGTHYVHNLIVRQQEYVFHRLDLNQLRTVPCLALITDAFH